MRTSEFIAKHKQRIDNGEPLRRGTATCASVMADNDRIYSYGYHYPLLFQVETHTGRKIWVCNNGGYSSTTSKHISYSAHLADICAPVGGIGSGMCGRVVSLVTVVETLEYQKNYILRVMATKKRTNTKVYRGLVYQLATINTAIRTLHDD